MLQSIICPGFDGTLSRLIATSLLLISLVGCGDDSGTNPDTLTVGPEGGTLRFASGRVVLSFPAAAVNQGVQIRVVPASDFPNSSLIIDETVYEIDPLGLSLNVPARVTVFYDPMDLPAGTTEPSLALHFASGDEWQRLPSNAVSEQGNSVSADIDELSKVAILWLPPAPIGATFPATPVGARFARHGEWR